MQPQPAAAFTATLFLRDVGILYWCVALPSGWAAAVGHRKPVRLVCCFNGGQATRLAAQIMADGTRYLVLNKDVRKAAGLPARAGRWRACERIHPPR